MTNLTYSDDIILTIGDANKQAEVPVQTDENQCSKYVHLMDCLLTILKL